VQRWETADGGDCGHCTYAPQVGGSEDDCDGYADVRQEWGRRDGPEVHECVLCVSGHCAVVVRTLLGDPVPLDCDGSTVQDGAGWSATCFDSEASYRAICGAP
jgi:hypothetical protein